MQSDDEELDPQADCFRPPSIPTMVYCLHCQEEYDSWKMEYRVQEGRDGRPHGFWCCGTPGCDGVGFGFDIYPLDEHYIDPDGRDMGEWVDDEPADPETDFDRPPQPPTPVRCERCGQAYRSDEMVWDEFAWMCKTSGCNGMGFGYDVRPTDPTFVDPLDRPILRPGEVRKPPDPDEEIPF